MIESSVLFRKIQWKESKMNPRIHRTSFKKYLSSAILTSFVTSSFGMDVTLRVQPDYPDYLSYLNHPGYISTITNSMDSKKKSNFNFKYDHACSFLKKDNPTSASYRMALDRLYPLYYSSKTTKEQEQLVKNRIQTIRVLKLNTAGYDDLLIQDLVTAKNKQLYARLDYECDRYNDKSDHESILRWAELTIKLGYLEYTGTVFDDKQPRRKEAQARFKKVISILGGMMESFTHIPFMFSNMSIMCADPSKQFSLRIFFRHRNKNFYGKIQLTDNDEAFFVNSDEGIWTFSNDDLKEDLFHDIIIPYDKSFDNIIDNRIDDDISYYQTIASHLRTSWYLLSKMKYNEAREKSIPSKEFYKLATNFLLTPNNPENQQAEIVNLLDHDFNERKMARGKTALERELSFIFYSYASKSPFYSKQEKIQYYYEIARLKCKRLMPFAQDLKSAADMFKNIIKHADSPVSIKTKCYYSLGKLHQRSNPYEIPLKACNQIIENLMSEMAVSTSCEIVKNSYYRTLAKYRSILNSSTNESRNSDPQYYDQMINSLFQELSLSQEKLTELVNIYKSKKNLILFCFDQGKKGEDTLTKLKSQFRIAIIQANHLENVEEKINIMNHFMLTLDNFEKSPYCTTGMKMTIPKLRVKALAEIEKYKPVYMKPAEVVVPPVETPSAVEFIPQPKPAPLRESVRRRTKPSHRYNPYAR